MLLSVVAEIEEAIRDEVLPEVSRAVESSIRVDAPADEIRAAFARLRERLGRRAGRLEARVSAAIEGVASSTADFNRAQLNRSFEATVGVGLPAFEPGIGDALRSFVAENVGRIEDLAESTLSRVEGAVFQGFRRGRRVEEIAGTLQSSLRISRDRARLIARDQISSLNSELTRIRQTTMGVESYRWRTVGDDLVRDSHQEFEGQIFTWAEGSPEGHPGEPINCRCWAEPVLDQFFEEG